MAALVASVATAVCLWFNVSLGPLARADFPALEMSDQAYPLMLKSYLPTGLIGLVLAGLVAGGYSTFDSIGIGISSLFVRDIYARFIVKDGSDAHYTRVGRITVPFIILLGFLYVPFLKGGMVLFYLRLAGAIQVPLMTVILMGVFTPGSSWDRYHRTCSRAYLRYISDYSGREGLGTTCLVYQHLVGLSVEFDTTGRNNANCFKGDRSVARSRQRGRDKRTSLCPGRGNNGTPRTDGKSIESA